MAFGVCITVVDSSDDSSSDFEFAAVAFVFIILLSVFVGVDTEVKLNGQKSFKETNKDM